MKKIGLFTAGSAFCMLFVSVAFAQQNRPGITWPDSESIVDGFCETEFQLQPTSAIQNGYVESIRPIAESVRAVVVEDVDALDQLRHLFSDLNDDALVSKFTGYVVSSLVSACPAVRDQIYASLGSEPNPNASLLFIRDKIAAEFEDGSAYDELTRSQREDFALKVSEWSVPFTGDDAVRQADYLAYMLESSERFSSFMIRLAAERSLHPDLLSPSADDDIARLLEIASSVADVNSLTDSGDFWDQFIAAAEADGFTLATNAVSDMGDKIGFLSDLGTVYQGTQLVFMVFLDKNTSSNLFVETGDANGNRNRMNNFFGRMHEYENDRYQIHAGKTTLDRTLDMWIFVGNRGFTINGRLVSLEKYSVR